MNNHVINPSIRKLMLLKNIVNPSIKKNKCLPFVVDEIYIQMFIIVL